MECKLKVICTFTDNIDSHQTPQLVKSKDAHLARGARAGVAKTSVVCSSTIDMLGDKIEGEMDCQMKCILTTH